MHHSFGSKSMEAKIEWKLTWQCCNPEKGRVDFEDGWLIKSSFKRMKFKDCQLNRTKFPAKKNIFIEKYF